MTIPRVGVRPGNVWPLFATHQNGMTQMNWAMAALFQSQGRGSNLQARLARLQLRRTELPSGVIRMGVRSYVPTMGRFLSPDPIPGGSANAYEYASGDPVNNFDLTGERCRSKKRCGKAFRRAKRRVRRSIRRVRALARQARARHLGLPGVNFRLPWEDDVNKAMHKTSNALVKAEEAATCEAGGLAAGGGSLYVQSRANRIAQQAPEVYRALSKLSTRLGTVGLVLGVASFFGFC
jgi:RHS repeat-associated protein